MFTRKNLTITSTFLILALLLVAVFAATQGSNPAHASNTKTRPSVFALEHQHGHAGGSVSPASISYTCPGAVNGNRVINVTEKVTNDADSGLTNYWALDTYTRTIKVWNVGPDSYCGVETYVGTFAAVAGQQSPGTTTQTGGTLSGEEGGTIKGAIQVTITGQLDVSNPSVWPLAGKVNSGSAIDYGCTGFTPGTSNISCPGYVNWVDQYFANGYTFNSPQFNFKYVGKDQLPAPDAGKSDGQWVDANTGIVGDILDID